MTSAIRTAESLRSGKGHNDENFPVASRIISERHRAPIMAFYNFVRTADDVADHAGLTEAEKLQLLDQMEATLLGRNDIEPAGVALRKILRERDLTPRHAQDLLAAFRLDATKRRYRDWNDLIDYCRLSAMPVGRFVLDVHGENRSTWLANDALCAALQINNHLQDCAKDFRDLDRVYVPLDALAAAGASVEDLGAARASPALRQCLRQLAVQTQELLVHSAVFKAQINDLRLSLEVSVIQLYAERIVQLLLARDPLSETVHLSKAQFMAYGLLGLLKGAVGRVGRPKPPSRLPQDA